MVYSVTTPLIVSVTTVTPVVTGTSVQTWLEQEVMVTRVVVSSSSVAVEVERAAPEEVTAPEAPEEVPVVAPEAPEEVAAEAPEEALETTEPSGPMSSPFGVLTV